MVRKPTYEELEQTVSRLLTDLKDKSVENILSKRTFLSMVSHEIRTPMHAILGFVQLMGKADLGPEEKEEYLSLIQQSGNHLLSVLDTMIDASLLDSGDLKLNLKDCRLDDLFQGVYNRFSFVRRQMERYSVALLKNVELPEKEFTILADWSRLDQVLSMLLDHALQHTQKGIVEFGCQINGQSHIIFFVSDSGGRPHGRKIKDLVPDLQKGNSATGGNLGISITRDLIDLMGGRIWVEENDFKGTTVCFSIPMLYKKENKTLEETKGEKEVKKNIA